LGGCQEHQIVREEQSRYFDITNPLVIGDESKVTNEKYKFSYVYKFKKFSTKLKLVSSNLLKCYSTYVNINNVNYVMQLFNRYL